MRVRRVVYTVLIGGYEPLLEQHVASGFDTDLVCFTDDPDVSSRTWQVRHVEPWLSTDPGRSSRRPKILAHEYLPDYDESIYVDNSVLLTADPAEIFDELLSTGFGMAALAHSSRGPVREEFEAVTAFRREAAWVCDEQLAHYTAHDADGLEEQTLWGGLLVRRHHEPAVRTAMVAWWEHVLRFSRRDQLSLPFVLRATNVEIAVHQLDNALSELHEWPRGAAVHVRPPSVLPPGPEATIAELEARAAALEVRAAESEARAAELEAVAARLEAARDLAVCQRDGLAADAVRLEDSLSWRLTRPLRAVKRVARRAGAVVAFGD